MVSTDDRADTVTAGVLLIHSFAIPRRKKSFERGHTAEDREKVPAGL